MQAAWPLLFVLEFFCKDLILSRVVKVVLYWNAVIIIIINADSWQQYYGDTLLYFSSKLKSDVKDLFVHIFLL